MRITHDDGRVRFRYSPTVAHCNRCDFASGLTECLCDHWHDCVDGPYEPECLPMERCAFAGDTGAAGMGTILATFTALVLGLVLGLTSSMWNPYAIAGDTAVREHQQRVIDHGVCYEDGSCDDGYCTPGAYCDDTVAVTREDDHR